MKKLLLLAYCMTLSYIYTNAQITVYVIEPPSISGAYAFTWADPAGGWGTADLNNPLNSVQDTLMLVDDGTAADSLGCNFLVNNLTGKIAVVYRGACEFGTKALNAQNAGAVGVILINSIAGGPVGMASGTDGALVTIPLVMISMDDGAALRAEMDAGTDVIAFIGNKAGLFNNDLGMAAKDVLMARATANPALVSQNATEFNVPMGAWIFNFGIDAQTNVTLTADITGADNYSVTSSPIPSIASGDSAYVSLTAYSASSYSGLYHINYTINADNVDDFTSDNTFYASFLIDSLISYAFIDSLTELPVSSAHFSLTTPPTVYENCIHFRDPNASRLSALGIYSSASGGAGGTLVGELIEARVYEWNDVFTGLSTAPVSPWALNQVASQFYTYSADLQREMVYIPFSIPLILIDDQRYLFCAVTYNAADVYLGFDTYYDYTEVINNYDQPVSIVMADADQFATGFGTNVTSSVSVRVASSSLSLGASASGIDACNGCDGQATVTVFGGTSPYTYLWNDPSSQTNATAINLCVGSYSVLVTDALSDTVSASATISSTGIGISTTTSASCDSLIGSATATPTGGTAPYTYLWNDPSSQTTQTATGLSSGTNYMVTITDAGGCSNSSSITIPIYYPVSATVTGISPSVCGGSDGSAFTFAVNGTGSYQYFWPTLFQFTSSVSGLSAGSYTVQVTDSGGCSVSVTVTISDPGAQILTMTGSDPGSCTSNDGTATATPTGGTPLYTYLWDDLGSQTTQTATGLGSGTFTVTVTDASGCIAFGSSTLTAPGAPSVTTSGSNPSCGSTDGTATATASGGTGSYTYAWDDPGTQTTSTATGLTGGTFSVTVTDAAGCTATSSTILSSAAAPTVTVTGSNPSSCGATNGSASSNVTGGTPPYTYAWSSGGNAAVETGLGAGNYMVTISDASGCSDTASVVLTDPGAPTILVTSSDANCTASDGSASAFPSGGASPYSFLWDDPAAQVNAIATGLASGTYSVTVTDNSGCTSTASIVVGSVGTGPALSLISTDVNCYGGSNGSAAVTATGGAGTYTYAWSNGATVAIITGLSAGTYTISVTDANGCQSDSIVVVSEPGQIVTLSSVVEADCDSSNGAASLTSSGGTPPYSYQWDASAGNQTSQIATGLSAGVYIVTVTDGNSCSETVQVNISNIGAATVTIAGSNVSCFGGSDGAVATSVIGGTPPLTFSWSNGANSQNLSGLQAGDYTLILTDSINCIVVQSITITSPNPILITTSFINVSTPTSCDGSATAIATDGTPPYSYLWDDQGAQTTSTAVGLCVGNYNITVTDANNCTAFGTVFVDSIAMGIEIINPVLKLSLFPNPTKGTFDIVVTGISEFDLEIRNIVGQVIYSMVNAEKHGTQQRIQLQNPASGIYFLIIRSGEGIISKKLVIE